MNHLERPCVMYHVSLQLGNYFTFDKWRVILKKNWEGIVFYESIVFSF